MVRQDKSRQNLAHLAVLGVALVGVLVPALLVVGGVALVGVLVTALLVVQGVALFPMFVPALLHNGGSDHRQR
jgi:ABC-type transport system involved in cytochrome bd biosynthesis fused ATPase/permease subunit